MATLVPLALLVLSSYLPPFVSATASSSAAVFLHCGQHETGLVVSPALFSNSLTDFLPLKQTRLVFLIEQAECPSLPPTQSPSLLLLLLLPSLLLCVCLHSVLGTQP